MSTNAQDGSRPTVVLVHGGFADGSGWQGVYNELKDAYSVRIVQEPNLSHQGDVEATKLIIGQQSAPVVLVGHSYGGAVITEAGNHPHVAALVYVAGFVPDQGESVETLLGTFPPGEPNAGEAILPPQDGFLFLEQLAMSLVRDSSWGDGCLFRRSQKEDSPSPNRATHEQERGRPRLRGEPLFGQTLRQGR
jgi:pimeloyl-ACP methyl ester carboxylesterase